MSNIAKVDKFDERKNELNEIKKTFNEFVDIAEAYGKISCNAKLLALLSNIKSNFNTLFEILYSTNESNRLKGYKDYSATIPDAESKFGDRKDLHNHTFDFKNDLSILNVTKCIVFEILLKINYFPLIIRKEIFNCLYKLIDCENIEETEKARCDIPENYKGDFINILFMTDFPNVIDVISKITGEKPPKNEFFNFQYEKRFNCFADVNATMDLDLCYGELNFSFKDKLRLEKYIKAKEFLYDQAEKRNIGSKEVIEIVKKAFKMLSDDLKKNEISDKTSNTLRKMIGQIKHIVKSTYGLEDLNEIVYIIQ